MDSRQTRLLLFTIACIVLLWIVAPFVAGTAAVAPVTPALIPAFDGGMALERASEFGARFPARAVGSLESRQSSGVLQQQFKSLGYELGYLHFDALVRGRREAGRNLIALKEGRSPEIIAVMAHYDNDGRSPRPDGASTASIGVLLELARVFSSGDHARTLLLVATDASQIGASGARDFVATHPRRDRVVAAVVIGRPVQGRQAGVRLQTAGGKGGQTPPWLRTLAISAAEAEGVAHDSAYGPAELIERALRVAPGDQGPLLDAGLPAIGIAPVRTTPETAASPAPEELARTGRTAERIVYALETLQSIPRESQEAIFVTPGRVMPAGVVHFLEWLVVVPPIGAVVFLAKNHGRYLSAGRLAREVAAIVACAVPLVSFYYLVHLVRLIRRLPRYPFLPPAGEPSLANPPGSVVWSVVVSALLVGAGCYFVVRYLSSVLPRPDFNVSKLVSCGLAVLCMLGAAACDRSWMVVFFALPVWIWILIGGGETLGARTANRLLIVAAGIGLPLAVVLSFGVPGSLSQGLWVSMVMLGNGVIRPASFMVGAFAFSLMVRIAAIQSHSRG